MIVATVLYEDSIASGPGKSYPLHDLVMRMVEDDLNGHTYLLRPLVDAHPRNGIDKVIKDLERADIIAGGGAIFLLVDRDDVAEHLGLTPTAGDGEVCKEIQRRGALTPIYTHFLRPNLEGLLRSIQACDGAIAPLDMPRALKKKLNSRDVVFTETMKGSRKALRACVRSALPDLDALVKAIAQCIPPSAIGRP